MRRRNFLRKQKQLSEINVVPYIDVMLVLLVIFMVTVPIIQQGINVDLPNANTKTLAVTEQTQPIVLTINKEGKFFLNIGESNRSLSAKTLINRTAAAISQNKNAPVLVKSDKTVAYAIVVRAMSYLQVAGAKSIGLITEDPEQ